MEARAYVEQRQLTQNVVRKFGLGLSTNRGNPLMAYLQEQGFAIGELLQSGLVIENKDKNGYHDRFRGRLMFPIFDPQGRVVGFGGRVIGKGGQLVSFGLINDPALQLSRYSRLYIRCCMNPTEQFVHQSSVFSSGLIEDKFSPV